jgi:acylphosphatase
MSNPIETSSVHLHITGRVKAYYRASMLQEALQIDLTGWVMNRPDGSVEAVAEGSKAKLDELIAWCHRGPEGARIAVSTRSGRIPIAVLRLRDTAVTSVTGRASVP